MDLSTFVTLAKQFGPLASTVVFFLWRDYRREDRMSARIDLLENEMRNVIMPLVAETAATIAQNTAVLKRIEPLLERR